MKRKGGVRKEMTCVNCWNIFKPTNNRSYECYDCVPEEHRNFNHKLKGNYGKQFGYVAYMKMLAEQNNSCKICGITVYPRTTSNKSDSAVVDHCHTHGHIRGILCRRCNLGLGYFDDDVDKFKSAITYLSNPANSDGGEEEF